MSSVLLTTANDDSYGGAEGRKVQRLSKFTQGSLPIVSLYPPADNGTLNQCFRSDNGQNCYTTTKTVVTKTLSGNSADSSTPPCRTKHRNTDWTNTANGFVNKPNKHHRKLSSNTKLNSNQMQHPSSQTRCQKRLVFKSGDCNISHLNIRKRRRRFLADIFTTLVDMRWRWNLLLFTLAFILSWLVFALVWWIICFSHGDFQHIKEHDWKPCVEKVVDFTSALLFSIETQHTIGYGHRHTTPHCPEAVVVMMIQSVFGVIIQALMTGLVFAKLQRPKKRAQTLMFSKYAVICQRDGQLCLLFRVGDMRKSHIIQSQVRAIVIKKRVTKEGEEMPLNHFDVRIGGDSNAEGHLFLVWPMILEHRIDEQSPFWGLAADDLLKQDFELIVMLEGIVESTGMTTQARTSYVPSEILWGHRFRRLVAFQKDDGAYTVDFSLFNVTYPVPTPTCSARELSLAETTVGVDQSLTRSVSDDESDLASDRSPSAVSEPIGGQNDRRPPTPSIMKWRVFGETNGLESFLSRDEEQQRLVSKHADVTACLQQIQSG